MNWRIITDKLDEGVFEINLIDEFGSKLETQFARSIKERTQKTKEIAIKYSSNIVKIEHHE